jgi:putative membrane protein
MSARRVLLSLFAVPTLTIGCRIFRPIDPNAPKTGTAPSPAATTPAPAAAPAPAARPAAQAQSAPRGKIRWNDAGVAAMVMALNYTDISYARLAPARAEREDVKQFANRMLTDHSGVNASLAQLLQKLDLTPEDNAASLDMRDESSTKRDLMRDLNGRAFDSTYIENEVTYHQKFLNALDQELIPAARNGELRALLTNVRPAVAAHLAHAEQVRSNILAKR